MPLDGNKLREIEFHLEVLDERLARMEHRGTHRSDDAGWAEHKHPRGPDGKFTSGSGAGKTKSIAKDYMSKLANAGKTIPVQGFIKHLINSGVPVKNIIEATKEEFGEAASASQIHSIYNKKMLPNDPNLKLNHDHWDEPYHGEPEGQPEPVSKGEAPVEPEPAPAPSVVAKKGELSPETKSIYQKNIDDWQHSMQNGDDELKAKFDEVMDAQLESDPTKKQAMIAALTPMAEDGSGHDVEMNEFIAGMKADAGASEGKSASSEQPLLSGYPAKPAGLTEQQQKQVGYIDKLAAGGEAVGGFKPDNLVGYLNSQHAMADDGPVKEYLGKVIAHLNGHPAVPEPERVLPPKPASGAMPEPPAGLGTGDIIKKVALGQLPSFEQSPAEQLQSLIDSPSSSQEEKTYAQKLLDHLNGEASAPGPASSAATAPSANPHANGVKPPQIDTSGLTLDQQHVANNAYEIAIGKYKPTQGNSVDWIKKYLAQSNHEETKSYIKGILDGMEDGTVPLPKFEPPVPPSYLGKLNAKACEKAYSYAKATNIDPSVKIDLLKQAYDSAPKDSKIYIANLSKVVKANKANAEYVPPNAGPVANGHKLSAETHKELAENAQHWDKVGPSLKPAVDEKHNELKAALAHPTSVAQKNAIAALKPIENPSGMGQKSMNAFIAKVQNEYGVAPQPSTTAPTASPTPAQQAKAQTNVAAALKKAPHKVIKHINELEDHTGAMVQAKHVADTSKILGDHYHKVTAAYGNSQDALAPAVDKAMTNYWKDIDKTWDKDLRDAIYAYQNGHSSSINQYFREGPNTVNESTKTKVAKMQKALESSFVPADTPAWRGLSCKFEELTGFADPSDSVGRCFEHKNFASISRRKQTSLNFGSNVLMKMTIPAGTPGLVVGGQTDGDGGKHNEKEIILGPYSMWRIDKYEKGAQGANHLIHVTYLGERTDGKHDMTTKDN